MASIPQAIALGQNAYLGQQQAPVSLQALINQTKLQQQSLQQQQALAPIQQQIAQSQAQQQQAAATKAQEAVNDDQTFRQLLRSHAGDADPYGSAIAEAPSAGVGPGYLNQIQLSRIAQREKMAGLDSALLKNEQDKWNGYAQDAIAVQQADPEDRQALWTKLANGHYAAGTAAPGSIPAIVPNDDGLNGIIAHSKDAVQQLTDAQTLKTKQEQDPGIQATTAATRLREGAGILSTAQDQPGLDSRIAFLKAKGYTDDELKQYPQTFDPNITPTQLRTMALTPEQAVTAGTSTAVADSQYRNNIMQVEQGKPLSPQQIAFDKAYEKQKRLVAATRIALERTPFDIYGGTPAAPGAIPATQPIPGAAPATVAPAPLTQGATNLPRTPVPAAPTGASTSYQPGAPAMPASTMQTADNNPKVIQGASPTDPGNWAKVVDSYRDPATGRPISPQYRGILLQQLNYLGKPLPLGRPNSPNYAITNLVQTLDPSHDDVNYGGRNTILQQYTKSATDGQLSAVNTALGHLGELYEAAKLLDGSNLPALHALQSKWGLATGDDAAATYQYIAGKVGDELTSAYVKGGGGEKDRAADQSSFSINRGQQQIISTIGSAAALLNSKIASDRNNWQQTFNPQRPQDQFDNRWLTPEARRTVINLSQLAPTATVRVRAPNGAVGTIPRTQLDAAQKAGYQVAQ